MNHAPDLIAESNSAPPFEMDANGALLRTHLPLPCRRGKVRDVYDLGDRLMIVSTDRISAFDFILPSGIPSKGQILTSISRRWFDQIDHPHHLVSTDLSRDDFASSAIGSRDERLEDWLSPESPLFGRVMVVQKAAVVPYECVVRGYLEGSGYREYQRSEVTGEPIVGGNPLPKGLKQCDRLPTPIFTPATKAEEGHDENVTFEEMASDLGDDLASELREQSIGIYERAAEYARGRGILIADTKFEFGRIADGRLILIDEVLTPDSSRFWSVDDYEPGRAQRSMDTQFVREYLMSCGWDRCSDPPPLPPEVIEQTVAKYRAAGEMLFGAESRRPQPT